MSRVAVVGLGYVGLTTTVGLGQLGHNVLGFDVDKSKVEDLSKGRSPIFELGLEAALASLLGLQNLDFTDSLEVVAEFQPEFVFICVATPQDETGSADLSILKAAIYDFVAFAPKNSVLVLKSTVPVGTGRKLALNLKRDDIFIASNPEFLREGTAIQDFMEPDRIVVGANTAEVARRVLGLYDEIDSPKLETSLESSELIKYAANAYLAMRLSFTNDIANLAEKSGAEVDQVLYGMGLDKRIGNAFLKPGPGWGGSCFPKDTNALLAVARSYEAPLPLVESTILANQASLKRSVKKIEELAGGDLAGKIIAVWGVAFKANTDDIRDSPSLTIINSLIELGAVVRAYDPVAKSSARNGFSMAHSAIEAARGADVLAVLTEWNEFTELSPREVAKVMKSSHVFDARRILPETWRSEVSILRILGEATK